MTRIEKAKKAIDMGLGVVASGEYWVVRLVKGMDITDIPIDQWEPEETKPNFKQILFNLQAKHGFDTRVDGFLDWLNECGVDLDGVEEPKINPFDPEGNFVGLDNLLNQLGIAFSKVPKEGRSMWTEAEIREVLSKHYFWNDEDIEQGHLGEEIINQLKAKS